MCKASKDLQKLKALLFEDGDYFVNMEQLDLTKDKIEAKLASSCRCFDTPVNNTLKVWIPIQEQIQELAIKQQDYISKKKGEILLDLFCKHMTVEIWKSSTYYFDSFNTISEKWLAFYMSLDNMIWNFETFVWETLPEEEQR